MQQSVLYELTIYFVYNWIHGSYPIGDGESLSYSTTSDAMSTPTSPATDSNGM